ncbi:MAG TPA: CHASE2 domain-containing protein, partial [Crenalkalicoccus sp.]|nr:CHASE2 domain-containing protein [Crenalkalicoccus sp.]
AALLLVLLLRSAGWLQPLELAAYDQLVAAHAGTAAGGRIVLVTVTEEDISQYGWPLRDRTLAAVITKLLDEGAVAVGIDLYRDKPLGPGTEQLEALQRNPAVLWVYKAAESGQGGVPPPPGVAGTGRALLSDMVVDPGGMVRRGLLAAEDPETGRTVRTLGAALAERFLGERLRPDGDGLALGGGHVTLVGDRFGPFSEVDAGGYQMLLDFRGGTRSLPRFSLAELAARDLSGEVGGRIVILGNAALSVKDSFGTPLQTGLSGAPALPGLALHGMIADQLIRYALGESRERVPLPHWVDTTLIWAAALGGVGLAVLCSSGLAALAGFAAACALLVGLSWKAFALGFLVPGAPMGLALVLAAASVSWVLRGRGRRERIALRRSFEHYLDRRIITSLLERPGGANFGGEYREISVLFTDLTDFTTLAESLPASTVAELLHDYFDGVCAAVVAAGGLVNNFTGDGVMALFGAPQPQADHADRAMDAALAVDDFSRRFQAARLAEGIAWGGTRIGVHTGMALVGNVGTRAKLQYGAVGDVLNTASRLEGLNKAIGTRIAVSGETARRCLRHRFRPVGDVVLKGRRAALPVLTPVLAGAQEEGVLPRYEAAFEALRAGRAEAAALFEALHAEDPAEPCTAFHRERLAAGERGVLLEMRQK